MPLRIGDALNMTNLMCEPDGSFEIVIAAERPAEAKNFLEIDPDVHSVLVRQFFADPAEEPARYMIERIDQPGPSPRPTDESTEHRLRSLVTFLHETGIDFLKAFGRPSPVLPAVINKFDLASLDDQASETGRAVRGGTGFMYINPDHWYLFCKFELADDRRSSSILCHRSASGGGSTQRTATSRRSSTPTVHTTLSGSAAGAVRRWIRRRGRRSRGDSSSRGGLARTVRRCRRAGAGHELGAGRRPSSGGPHHMTDTSPHPLDHPSVVASDGSVTDAAQVPGLEVDSVTKTYPGEPPVQALRGLNLTIAGGAGRDRWSVGVGQDNSAPTDGDPRPAHQRLGADHGA